MKKLLLSLAMVMLFTISIATAAITVSVPTYTPADARLNVGDSLTAAFTVSTDEAGPIDLKLYTSASLVTFNPTLSTSQLVGLTNAAPQTVTVTLSVPLGTPLGAKTGNLEVRRDGVMAVTGPITFTVVEVPPVKRLETTTVTSVEILAEDDNEVIKSFTIRNTGNVNLNGLTVGQTYTVSNLQDDDGDVITVTTELNNPNLLPNAEATVTVRVNIESGFDIKDLKTGKIQIKELNNVLLELPLEISVGRLQCSSGNVGRLELDGLNDIEDNDYQFGDSLPVNIEVTNNGEDSVRVRLELELFNKGSGKRVYRDLMVKRVRSDNNEDFDFGEILLDADNIEIDEDYILFLKAFEDGEEDVNCRQDSVEFTIEEPTEVILVDSFTVSPNTLTCGATFNGLAQVRNIGLDEERLRLVMKNEALGILEESEPFNLAERDTGSSSATSRKDVRFTNVQIPATASDGTYDILVQALYGNLDVSEQTQTLTLQGCSASQTDEPITGDSDDTNNVGADNKGTSFFSNTGNSKVPNYVWVILDIALVLVILAALVYLFRGKRQ